MNVTDTFKMLYLDFGILRIICKQNSCLKYFSELYRKFHSFIVSLYKLKPLVGKYDYLLVFGGQKGYLAITFPCFYLEIIIGIY